MKSLVLLTAAFGLLGSASFAADMPAKSPPAVVVSQTWSGFYVGANAGGGWGSSCWTFVGPFDFGCDGPSGALAGGQFGYNWQIGRFVIGAELSGDWANLKGSHTPAIATEGTEATRISSILLATARAGITWDRALLYAKGGAAWVRSDYDITCNGITSTGVCVPAGTVFTEARSTRLGWTVGAGLEYMLLRNISIGLEYNYVGLGSRDVTFSVLPGYDIGCGIGASCPISIKQNVQMVTARLNWHFGSQ